MSNTSARHLLEQIYGKGCMFQKAYIAKRIEEIGGIKTYKQYVKETHYKRRKIHVLENRMTYHHLQHRSEGGKTTGINGSIVGELPHRYIHSLPREQEELINNMLREYKYDILVGKMIVTSKDIKIEDAIKLPTSFDKDDDFITISLEDNFTDKKYNRAKEKEEFYQLLKEYFEEQQDIDERE